MNHNLETVPRLYKQARPGADYAHSLKLLQEFRQRLPAIPTKSGLMVGLGETDEEILAVMRDLRAHAVEMLTIGQYLAPSGHHLPVMRYVHPDVFKTYATEAEKDGLHPLRQRAAGAFELPRRPAGASRREWCNADKRRRPCKRAAPGGIEQQQFRDDKTGQAK